MSLPPPSPQDQAQPEPAGLDLTPPWSIIVVGHREDAERARAQIDGLNVYGLDDPDLHRVLPNGPGSCVLLVGAAAQRAERHVRGFGVVEVYGVHLPLGCDYLSQFLEERAAAVGYFGGSAHLREVLHSWLGRATRLECQPASHPDLVRPPRLRGRPFQELLDLPTPRTLILNTLAEQAVSVLGGVSRGWKTFLVLDWHLCLYWSIAWRGQRVRPGNSVYFCGEGQAYAGRRVKAWLQHHAELIRDKETNGRVFEIVGEVPRLTQPEGIAELREYLRAFVKKHGSVSLITFDTLSVALSGDDDENSNATMGAVTSALIRIRNEFSCTIILVHHLRKDSPDAPSGGMNALRGGGALPCNVDQVFLVTVKDEEQILRLEKFKDGEDGREIARSNLRKIHLGNDEEGPITSAVLVPVDERAKPGVADIDERVAQLVAHYRTAFGYQEFTQSKAEKLRPDGWSRDQVRDVLDVARRDGSLLHRTSGKSTLHRVPGGGS
jgi:hypothetical protein